MCGESVSNEHWELVLHAEKSLTMDFPESLFFDDDIIWHKQQFGMTGHVAFAYLVVKDKNLYGLNYVSDIVQRISRVRKYKTQIEKKFKGWHIMLLNSILNFALELNIDKIYSPTADLAIKNTDPNRTVQRELFDRVYDRSILKYYHANRENEWWVMNVKDNLDKLVRPETINEQSGLEKTICLIHDTEKGLGHLSVDPVFSGMVDQESPKYTDYMLKMEQKFGIKATYNIVGTIFNEYRKQIEDHGHSLAFHSFNHTIEDKQLSRCRNIDYRIKGYRVPMSRISEELTDENLNYYNFEWFASSASSLGFKSPFLQNRLVKIPIHLDDYDLYEKGTHFSEWEYKLIGILKDQNFAAFGLHDCYGNFWMPFYEDFLEKIKDMGNFKTMDQISNDIFLSSTI